MERLLRLHPKSIDLSLGRIQNLLNQLGNPERKLKRLVHVAGTNGKGSVIALLRSCLEASGASVNVYTSPHLVRFHERIRIKGALIEESHLATLLSEVEQINASAPITFFEITTAAAFLAFARNPADFTLVEVGLGGRLDATNLVHPELAIITAIDFDHKEWLGQRLEQIASEKAGIIKPKVPTLVAPQAPEVEEIIARRVNTLGAQMIAAGRDFTFAPKTKNDKGEKPTFSFRFGALTLALPPPALRGRHQIDNAALAVAAALKLVPTMNRVAIARGLEKVLWPGRLQRLYQGKLVQTLESESELWLDGAHNCGAMRALANALDDLSAKNPMPLDLVVALTNNRDGPQILAPLLPRLRSIVCTRAPAALAPQDPKSLAKALKPAVSVPVQVCETIQEAIDHIPEGITNGARRIIVTGSLYLVAACLAENAADPAKA